MKKIKIGIIGHVSSDKSNLGVLISLIQTQSPTTEIEIVYLDEATDDPFYLESEKLEYQISRTPIDYSTTYLGERKGRRRGQRKGKRDWE